MLTQSRLILGMHLDRGAQREHSIPGAWHVTESPTDC